jgi:hypothetical protein
MTYIVAIPSYQRADTITAKTLKTLVEGGVEKERIHIFVANTEEEAIYKAAVPWAKVVVGQRGIAAQRWYISQFFPEWQQIVSMDDDVEEVLELRGDVLEKLIDLDGFFRNAFVDLVDKNAFIWGVYPVKNAFYMKPKKRETLGLSFIIGVMYGYINRHLELLRPSVSAEGKEDYENSILYYRHDRRVLRYNHITFKTKFFSKGGLGEEARRITANKTAAEYLANTYPEYISGIFVRKNGMTQVRLRRLS